MPSQPFNRFPSMKQRANDNRNENGSGARENRWLPLMRCSELPKRFVNFIVRQLAVVRVKRLVTELVCNPCILALLGCIVSAQVVRADDPWSVTVTVVNAGISNAWGTRGAIVEHINPNPWGYIYWYWDNLHKDCFVSPIYLAPGESGVFTFEGLNNPPDDAVGAFAGCALKVDGNIIYWPAIEERAYQKEIHAKGAHIATVFVYPGGTNENINTVDDDEDGGDDCNKPKCSDCIGMPQWSISEPYISLWLYDEPLGYQPSKGERISFTLAHKQREAVTGLDPKIFSVGKNWNFAWLSYISHDVSGSNIVNFPMGGRRFLGGTNDFETNTRITGDTNTGYTRFFQDGSKDVYGLIVTNYLGQFQKAFLTERWNPQGHMTRLDYYGLIAASQVVRLKDVVDGDGLTNWISYVSSNPYSTNLISQVTDPYGRTTTLSYLTNGLLTNITDVVGISTSFAYDTNNWVQSMTNSYGTTAFEITDTPSGGVAPNGRSVLVTEPDGGHQLYLYQDAAPGVASTTGSLPYTASYTNTFESTNLNYRNTFHWGPQQYKNLSTTNIAAFSAEHFRLARMKHWLKEADGFVGQTISFERAPSPDTEGSVEGQITWYDYPGKTHNAYQGTQSSPLFVAQVLPDGTTKFTRTERNAFGAVTNEVSTYSSAGGSPVLLRTNVYTYAANEIDLLTTVNPLGVLVSSNMYNANHQVTTNFNALGEPTIYTYDDSNRLSTITSPVGLLTTYIYGSDGFLSDQIVTGISTNSYTYANGLVLTHTDTRGLTVTNTYDDLQRLTRMDFPDGTFITNTYDRLDLVKTVDRMGFPTWFGYDEKRRKKAETNALGNYSLYSYCSCGVMDSMQDMEGHTTLFYYDNQSRLTNTLYADDYQVFRQYDLSGRLIAIWDSAGSGTTNGYNNQGLVVGVTNSFGRVQGTAYDILDRATNTVDANGVSVSMTYDNLNRIRTRTYPDTGVESFGYTPNYSGMTSYTNQLGQTNFYVYDVAGRKTAETNANSEVTQFTYSGAGDLLTLTDAKYHTTTWNYDVFGRATNKVDALTNVIFRYQYDANNRLTNRWTPAKESTVYTYDDIGNLKTVNYPASPDISLSYDKMNRLTNMVDAVGTTAYGYDDVGQLLSEDGPWNDDTVSYTYNNRLRSTLSLSQPSASAWSQSYGYDAARRLTNVTSSAGAFTYTLGGTSDTSPLIRKLDLPNGASITNDYDGLARLLGTYLQNSGGTNLDAQRYVYDLAGRRMSQTRILQTGRSNIWTQVTNSVDYGYDQIGQLKSAMGSEADGTPRLLEQLGYLYDAAGNLSYRTNGALRQVLSVDNLNRLTLTVRAGRMPVAGTTTSPATNVTVNTTNAFLYADGTFASTNHLLANGLNTFTAIAQDTYGRSDTNTVAVNLPTLFQFKYDLNGNLRTNALRTFDYDDENQLITVTESNSWKSEFVYDGKMRRRIQKDFAWDTGTGSWVQTAEIRFIYDGNVILQHRDGNNLPTLTLTRGRDLSGSLQGAGGIGGLLAMTENSTLNTQNSQLATSYYHADGNGNVTCLINTNQFVVARYLYDPFGNTLSMSGPKASANLYRFSSQIIHEQSGLYGYLYRWYDPNLQRWLNRDPIGEEGGLNQFTIIWNNIVNDYDVLGLEGGQSIAPIPSDQRQCCDQKTVDAGQSELNNRFQKAAAAAAAQGLQPADIGQDGASCKNSSSDILFEWILPTPKCWKCTLEQRNYFSDLKGSDHQTIICTSYPQDGPSREIIFDWWGDVKNSTHQSGGSPEKFRSKWPYLNQCKDNPFYTPCSKNMYGRQIPHTPSHSFPACNMK